MSSADSDSKIYVKMFGFFDMSYKNKSVFLETTSSIKSIAILRFLLVQKHKLFLAESIAENVWPENEYLDEKKVIRTYIHRLRRILAQDNAFKKDFSNDVRILNVKGSYMLETSGNVEIDTDRFEGFKALIERESDTKKLLALFEDMLSLYKGEFLEECRFDNWVLMLRNYYIRLFCTFVNSILTKLEANRAYAEMITVCERSLKIYELDESMNILFLKALKELDQVTNALKHYNYITSKMYNELSVTPSDKMRQMYALLKTKKDPGELADMLGTPLMDPNALMLMIDEAVKAQLAPKQNRYSIGYIKIVSNELSTEDTPEEGREQEKESPRPAASRAALLESLKQAIEYALRKNDMYVMTDDLSALVVLTDATEDSFPIIANRINQSFFSRHNGFDSKLHIKLYRSITVMG